MPSIAQEILERQANKDLGLNSDEGKRFKYKRLMGCILLFLIQIILLMVWGAFFFLLGALASFESIPPQIQNLITAIVDFLYYLFG